MIRFDQKGVLNHWKNRLGKNPKIDFDLNALNKPKSKRKTKNSSFLSAKKRKIN